MVHRATGVGRIRSREIAITSRIYIVRLIEPWPTGLLCAPFPPLLSSTKRTLAHTLFLLSNHEHRADYCNFHRLRYLLRVCSTHHPDSLLELLRDDVNRRRGIVSSNRRINSVVESAYVNQRLIPTGNTGMLGSAYNSSKRKIVR